MISVSVGVSRVSLGPTGRSGIRPGRWSHLHASIRQPRKSDPALSKEILPFRRALPAMERGAVDGLGRGLLRQRHGRELLRHPRMGAARPYALPRPPVKPGAGSSPGAQSHLRVHRGTVSPASSSPGPRSTLPDGLREERPGRSGPQALHCPLNRGNSSRRSGPDPAARHGRRAPAPRSRAACLPLRDGTDCRSLKSGLRPSPR